MCSDTLYSFVQIEKFCWTFLNFHGCLSVFEMPKMLATNRKVLLDISKFSWLFVSFRNAKNVSCIRQHNLKLVSKVSGRVR